MELIRLEIRRLIFALLGTAVLVNAALTFYENDMTGGPLGPSGDDWGLPADLYPPEIPAMRAGSLFITEHNLSIRMGRADASTYEKDSGTYSMNARASNQIYGDAYRQTLTGRFQTVYETGGKPSSSLSGSVERTRLIGYLDRSDPSASLDTRVSIDRPGSASYPASSVHLDLMSHRGSWTDLIWFSIPGLYGSDGASETGETVMDLSLDELGLNLDDARVSYSVQIVKDNDVSRVLFSFEGMADPGIRLGMSAAFTDGVPWPDTYSFECSGSYPSEEGALTFNMSLATRLIRWTKGSGAPVPHAAITVEDVSSPQQAAALPIAEVPREGGQTTLRFTPQDSLDHARSSSPIIDAFMRNEPGVSFRDMMYYRNETRGPSGSMVWNMTLTSDRMEGDSHPALTFEVAMQMGGDRLDMKRLVLLSVSTGYARSSGGRGRSLISLHDHEASLRSSPLYDRFFIGDQYAASHELRVTSRSMGANVTSVLLFNMLGLNRAQGSDLFISCVDDARDQKTMYAVVIDGTTGNVMTLLTASGHYMAVIGPYVPIPA